MKKSIKKINDELEAWRKEFTKNLVFHKWLYYVYFAFAVVLLVFMFVEIGSLKNQIYVKCDSDEYCKNPFYESGLTCNEVWCSWEMLPPKFEAGNPPSFLVKNAEGLLIVGFVLVVIVDVAFFNGGYREDKENENT